MEEAAVLFKPWAHQRVHRQQVSGIHDVSQGRSAYRPG